MTFDNEITLNAALEMLDAIKSLDKARRLFVMAGHHDMADDATKVAEALDFFSRAAAKRAQGDAA